MQSRILFHRYMDVVNQAMDAHRTDAPYKQFLALGRRALGDQPITAWIYKDEPGTPHDAYTIVLGDDGFTVEERGSQDDTPRWRIPSDHMEAVVNDPATFIARPEKLQLDWLWKRVGIAHA